MSITETLSPALPTSIEELAEQVLRTACDKELMLATAESCTGGLLASLLTDVSGASHAFERGFVTYSEQSKCELLGLAAETIDRCGVVSSDVAVGMANGALAGSKADVAVSVTGYAGSAPDSEEPGLVYIACARRGRPTEHREEHFGDVGRGQVRIETIRVALEMLEQALA